MKNKRFIAGATCPSCHELDKIFVYEEGGQQWRACVNCEFKESITAFTAKTEELPTRVNQHKLGEQPLPHETPVEAVNILGVEKDKNTKQ